MEDNTIPKGGSAPTGTAPQKKGSAVFILITIIALTAGLAGGWYYGQTQGYQEGLAVGKEEGLAEGIEEGKQIGREELLEEQEQTVQEVIDELQSAANPYEEEATGTNPFAEEYENPFAE